MSTDLMNDLIDEQPQARRGQLKLWIIIVIAAAPLVLAMVMYFGQIGIPTTTTNHGSLLIPPLQASALGLENLGQQEPELVQSEGMQKWLMLVVADGPCGARCEEALYLTRQVNTALGRDAGRVSRLLLRASATPGLATVLRQHDGLAQYPLALVDLETLMSGLADHEVVLEGYDILLMDPLGNIMMHYGAGHSGNDLLDDLKRLLKVSKIG